MAKYPAPGRVKTRLATVVGVERACALYRAFVLDLADRLAAVPFRVTWAYWPPGAPFAALLPGARCVPQAGGDLGARMMAAAAAARERDAAPVMVIGADVPHVSEACLDEAARALAGNSDLVLGPATDGGYYLIGMRDIPPALFTDIPWSTSNVLATTMERAGRLRLRTHLLPPEFDVDEAADLERLRAVLARREVVLPRTAALLARTGPGISA